MAMIKRYSKKAIVVYTSCVLWFEIILGCEAFLSHKSVPFVVRQRISTQVASSLDSQSAQTEDDKILDTTAVRAPLKFLGPYPCIGLNFPGLATSKQRTRNATGISLDFVLDTAANTNTINGQVAKELDLPVVGRALPGLGAGGAIQGGSTYLLGDSELEGIPNDGQFTFMTNLSASALPIASPAAAGLLSLAFFQCFEGGVEFQWQGEEGAPPSVTFYGEGKSACSQIALEDMARVSIQELPITKLPSVKIQINGVTMPALLDTGSPITVLNAQAAEQAGVKTVDIPGIGKNKRKGANPFANIANQLKEAQAAAQAAARGDVLTIAGTSGDRVDLLKSDSVAQIDLVGAEGDPVDFRTSHLYVGNLPGLAAMNALGNDSPPAAVVGMDVLRLRPKMMFRPRDKEVYF